MFTRLAPTLCLIALAGCSATAPDANLAEERETPIGSNISKRAGVSKVIRISPEEMRDVINSAPTTGPMKP